MARDAAVNRVCLSKSSKYVIIGCSDGELSVITAPDQQQVAKWEKIIWFTILSFMNKIKFYHVEIGDWKE